MLIDYKIVRETNTGVFSLLYKLPQENTWTKFTVSDNAQNIEFSLRLLRKFGVTNMPAETIVREGVLNVPNE